MRQAWRHFVYSPSIGESVDLVVGVSFDAATSYCARVAWDIGEIVSCHITRGLPNQVWSTSVRNHLEKQVIRK